MCSFLCFLESAVTGPDKPELKEVLHQFTFDHVTYNGACYLHWLILKKDVDEIRRRVNELAQCVSLCLQKTRSGKTKEVIDNLRLI